MAVAKIPPIPTTPQGHPKSPSENRKRSPKVLIAPCMIPAAQTDPPRSRTIVIRQAVSIVEIGNTANPMIDALG